jgi:hypothetical protein
VRILAEVDTRTPLLRLQADGAIPPIPTETSELLTAIDGAVWSSDQPWVIRLGTAGS